MQLETRDPLVLVVSADTSALPDVLARAQDEAELRHATLEVVATPRSEQAPPHDAVELVLVPRPALTDRVLAATECPVLVLDPEAPAGGRVVVALLRDDEGDAAVVRHAVGEARRRGDELRLLLAEGPGPRCTHRPREVLRRWERELEGVPGLRLSASCAATDATTLLAREAGGASVLVLDQHWPLLHLPPGDLVLVPDAVGRPDRLPERYRAALVRELARSARRRDGSRTPAQLDDAWRTNVADPPVSDDVVRSWRETQRPPTTWPPRRAAPRP